MSCSSRISESQYKALVEFMEENGDLTKPHLAAHGRQYVNKKWRELTGQLNSDGTGVPRPEDKWRKTWADMKCNVKKKYARIQNHINGTGGGPALNLYLSHLEDRVLQIMGTQAATGLQVEEVGFEAFYGQRESPDPDEISVYVPIYDDEEAGPSSGVHTTAASPNRRRHLNGGGGGGEQDAPAVTVSEEAATAAAPPAKKKRTNDDVAVLFYESDVKAREYAKEKDARDNALENERLRLRAEELKLREFEARERVRQRDLELQLYSKIVEVLEKFLERHE